MLLQNNVAQAVAQPQTQQTFDPFAESAAPAFESSSFDIQSPRPFTVDSRPMPPAVGNPFAIQGTAETQAVSSNNHSGGDLLDIFGSETQASNPLSQDDDIFDPLAQINGTVQEPVPPQQPNFPAFDQPQAQANFSSFDQVPPRQSENIATSVSRPKPAALSAGLLPPPPTKQTIKERNRNSNIAGELLQCFLPIKNENSFIKLFFPLNFLIIGCTDASIRMFLLSLRILQMCDRKSLLPSAEGCA